MSGAGAAAKGAFGWLRRPRGLRAQLIALLLIALSAATIASAVLFLDERGRALRLSVAEEAVGRVAGVAEGLRDAAPPDRPALLRAAGEPGLRLALDARPRAGGRGARPLAALAARLAAEAGVSPGDLRIALRGAPDGRGGRPGAGSARDGPQQLLVSIRVDPASWLNATFAERPAPLQWARPALASFALAAAFLAAVVWLAVGRIVRPLDALVRAADRLGLEGPGAPLPLTGPAEVQRLTAAYNAMAARLTRLLAERTAMLAAIGHDLRSPVTAMRLRLEMLEAGDDRERLTRCLGEIEALVEAGLALARGTGAEEALVPVDPWALVRDLVAELAEGGADAALESAGAASWPAGATVAARPHALRRAVRNLAENAVRHGGSARIALRAQAGWLRIEVRDAGPGIPPQDLERVFGPFVRLEGSRSRETGGAGLGLTIARAATEAQGGTLVLETPESGGLLAVLSLPAGAPLSKPV